MTLLAGDLRSFILGDSTVAALIGTRFYPDLLPQNAQFPAVSYNLVSETYGHVMRGPNVVSSARVQIDSWAETKEEAEAVSSAIHARLDAYQGAMGTSVVQGVFAADGRDWIEPSEAIYRRSRDYIIWHE